ncbi:MAG: transcriptional repressor [Candidatus Omnitrophica bacterium]|nr:transcriptional repressor [Candidatus Omnitrophota bacterium]
MRGYRQKLKKNGFKLTPGREAIIAFFSGKNHYATPETVWKEVRKSLPRLGLPTVYRNLEQMRKINILTQVDGAENRFYFGLCRAKNPGEHHHHISCQKCRRVSEVENCYLQSLTKEIKEKTGFQITGHKLQLTGVCKDCR